MEIIEILRWTGLAIVALLAIAVIVFLVAFVGAMIKGLPRFLRTYQGKELQPYEQLADGRHAFHLVLPAHTPPEMINGLAREIGRLRNRTAEALELPEDEIQEAIKRGSNH